MPSKKDAEYWRSYRSQRKTAGRALLAHDAAYYRDYRAKRRGAGKVVGSEKLADREFIAWDGEGVTIGEQTPGLLRSEFEWAARSLRQEIGGSLAAARDLLPYDLAQPAPHRYTMLANSRGTVVENAEGLSTQICFDTLLAGAREYPDAAHVIFGGSYDATMILLGLSRGEGRLYKIPESTGRDAIRAIVRNATDTPVWVLLGSRVYAVTYRQRKFLRIARFADRKQLFWQGKPAYDASITLWDVIGFFQSTFVKALKSYGIDADIAAIAKMKDERERFAIEEREQIRAYCVSECVALEKLAGKLWTSFLDAGLHPNRLDGAGAGAAALLKRERVKEHIHEEPEDLRRPIAIAFFGGRIEMLGIGRCGPLYGYDISSAYPGIAAGLPSLHGLWTAGNDPSADLRLHKIRYAFPRGLRWYPLPYRNPDATIVFGSTGRGWHWHAELVAAQAFAAKLGGRVTIEATWSFRSANAVPPFGFVPPIYDKRQVLKRAKAGAEKAIKLSLNSLYGKTAQQVGARFDRDGRMISQPPFFSLVWAGAITAGARAQLVRAALQDPEAIVAFATDGIYATRSLELACVPPDPHLEAALGAEAYPPLGGWEGPAIADEAIFAQAGIYWQHRRGEWEAKYRGFDRRHMESPAIALDAWARGDRVAMVEVTRFVTYGSALASNDLWEWRGTWRKAPRKLDLSGGSPKRRPFPIGARPDHEFVPLEPRENEWFEASGETSRAFRSITLARETIDGIPEDLFDEDVSAGYV